VMSVGEGEAGEGGDGPPRKGLKHCPAPIPHCAYEVSMCVCIKHDFMIWRRERWFDIHLDDWQVCIGVW